jgi:2-oxoglutarate ferredoxin oxidoreductase subunit delta
MNKLWIDERYCKGCLICIDACPTKAIRPSEKLNSKGYRLPIEENMALCKACEICVLMCPDFAIAVSEE